MEKSHQEARRKRVRRLKRMIITGILLAIAVPTAACIVLSLRVHRLEQKLQTLSVSYEELLSSAVDSQKTITITEIPAEQVAQDTADAQQETIPSDIQRKVYLTFDDGPSANTEKILEILDEYDVKATFFVTGEEAKSHPERYREIVERGHTLGMHSYSHKYGEIYASEENFVLDLKTLRDFLYDTTGVMPQYYRFPGGSSNTVSKVEMEDLCRYLDEEGIVYFDWNISSQDAGGAVLAQDIVANCTDGLEKYENAVILLHDSVKKDSTVEALPDIIKTIQAMEHTAILPITEDTVVVHHKNSK
ncbi:MAG: polysaccharide deacetylase family protein [Lachnospiraceae bacterium]